MESQQLHQNPHYLHGSAYASVTSKEVPSNQDPLAVSASNLPEFDRDSTKVTTRNYHRTNNSKPRAAKAHNIATSSKFSRVNNDHINESTVSSQHLSDDNELSLRPATERI
ncbi:hypothetical protein H762_YJM541O00364 [Saccharomyces cerevisiae YJM541]|nr:hypothetical protein H762_YJM541O00364 [Saccharomyces cerevisiae YJM541]